MSAPARNKTAKEAADALGVSDRTLTRLAKLEEIPASKINKSWRFDITELAAFFDRPIKSRTA